MGLNVLGYANGRARELNAYGINSSGEPDGNWSCKKMVLQEGLGYVTLQCKSSLDYVR